MIIIDIAFALIFSMFFMKDGFGMNIMSVALFIAGWILFWFVCILAGAILND